jgi:FKBP-type peptidyl-prolyl cis-trans isomerase FklB
MKHAVMCVVCLTLMAAPVLSEEKKIELKTPKEKLSYSIGFDMGSSLKRNGIDVDLDIVTRAIQDVLSGGKALMTEQEMRESISALQKEMAAKQQGRAKELGDKNRKEGEEFLAENKKKEGVTTLPSGLQYMILAEGKGKQPKATDTVTVQYRGTLIDGTEFDSSYKRGQPATFALNQVIKGWTEGVQLMKEGGKIRLFVPSELAYGDRGAGAQIGPNAALIFEVELLSIGDGGKAAIQPGKVMTNK